MINKKGNKPFDKISLENNLFNKIFEGKRAISPLIATVLLIGFAIAIAVVVIFWGTGIIKEQLDKTGNVAQGKLGCQQDVEIDLGSARCLGGGKVVIVEVENLGQSIIPNVRGRVIGDSGATGSLAGVQLSGNERKEIEFIYDKGNVGNPKAVEVVPVLYSGDNQVSCLEQAVSVELDITNC